MVEVKVPAAMSWCPRNHASTSWIDPSTSPVALSSWRKLHLVHCSHVLGRSSHVKCVWTSSKSGEQQPAAQPSQVEGWAVRLFANHLWGLLDAPGLTKCHWCRLVFLWLLMQVLLQVASYLSRRVRGPSSRSCAGRHWTLPEAHPSSTPPCTCSPFS